MLLIRAYFDASKYRVTPMDVLRKCQLLVSEA